MRHREIEGLSSLGDHAMDNVMQRDECAVRRILFVNSWSSCHGGSSTSLLDIVTHLERDRFEPAVQCPRPGELPNRLRELGVPVFIRRNSRLLKSTIVPFSMDVLSQRSFLRRESIDIVHSNVGAVRSSIVVAARLCGIPYIQHVRNPVNRPVGRLGIGFRWAARIITNSDSAGRMLHSDARLSAKTETIYNAVDLSAYDGRDTRRSELPEDSSPVIGFVGQLVPRKGVDTLIEAVARLASQFPKMLLVLVGCSPPGDDDYEKACRRRVTELGLGRHVVFTGFRRDVPAWMRTFDVFALPTRSEAFGKVIIEAMAAGCPVVTTNVGGIPEIVRSPELGTLTTPDSPDSTAAAIVEFLNDPACARRVGDAASGYVRERFGVETMIRKLQAVYDKVLEERQLTRSPVARTP